jgi:hypothetical protein
MTKIYEKRGRFCFRDSKGKLHKCLTQEDAVAAGGELATEPVTVKVSGVPYEVPVESVDLPQDDLGE